MKKPLFIFVALSVLSLAPPVRAALPPATVEALKAAIPLSFYAQPAGRVTKIKPLVSNEKRRPDGRKPVDVKSGPFVLLAFSDDAKCVEVAYELPGKGKEKAYTNAWFKVDDVLALGKAEPTNAVAGATLFLYSPYGKKRPALFGTADKNSAYADFGMQKVGREKMRLVIADGGKRTVNGHTLSGRLGYAREMPPVEGAADYSARVEALLDEEPYQSGCHWGDGTRPLLVASGNLDCAAAVTDFAKYVFDAGNFNRGEKFENVNEIRAGDVISIKGHFLSVLDRDGDKLFTFEGNFNKSIRRTDSGYAVVKGQWWEGGKANPEGFICGYHFLKAPLPKPIGKKLKKKK